MHACDLLRGICVTLDSLTSKLRMNNGDLEECDCHSGKKSYQLRSSMDSDKRKLHASVIGSSAGAMDAVLIAAGISPGLAANFVTSLTLPEFTDPPGVFMVFVASYLNY